MSTPVIGVGGREELREFDFSVVLAVQVVKQALSDLEVRAVADVHTRQELLDARNDAYDFLTRRLWDPECLWSDLLGHCLVRRAVLQEVAVRWVSKTSE